MSRASLRRPTDVLARYAEKIIAVRQGDERRGEPEARAWMCAAYAERARLVAVGFYQRAASAGEVQA